MIKKCAKCRQFKNLETNFKFIDSQGKYSSLCNECDEERLKKRRHYNRKRNLKKLWLQVTDEYSESEVEEFIKELKKMWRKQHG